MRSGSRHEAVRGGNQDNLPSLALLDEGVLLAELVAVFLRTRPVSSPGLVDDRFHALILLSGEMACVMTLLGLLGTLLQQPGVLHRDGGEDGIKRTAVVPIL